MDPTLEEIRSALNTILSDKVIMTWWQLILMVIISGIAAYFGAYLKKRGEDRATQDAIDKLTNSVESIKTVYSKDIENYKDTLLRKKIIFEHQVEAYNKLRRLLYVILPPKSHPDEEWDEALGGIALDFPKHGDEIKAYLIGYSGVLPEAVRTNVESCFHACDDGKFHSTDTEDFTGERFASALWTKLSQADSDFAKYLGLGKENNVEQKPKL